MNIIISINQSINIGHFNYFIVSVDYWLTDHPELRWTAQSSTMCGLLGDPGFGTFRTLPNSCKLCCTASVLTGDIWWHDVGSTVHGMCQTRQVLYAVLKTVLCCRQLQRTLLAGFVFFYHFIWGNISRKLKTGIHYQIHNHQLLHLHCFIDGFSLKSTLKSLIQDAPLIQDDIRYKTFRLAKISPPCYTLRSDTSNTRWHKI